MQIDNLKTSDPLQSFTKVIVKSGNEGDTTEFSAGNDSGRTLTVEIPWATQDTANEILKNVSGVSYQPFSANGATIDPAVELGDTITAGSVTERMFSQDLSFGSVKSSSIAAPGEEEIDHEFTFVPARERKVNRTLGGHARALKEQGESLLELNTGLSEITTVTEGPDGKPVYALAETKVESSILDKSKSPPEYKSAYLNAIVKYESGKSYSLAEIVADVITLNGSVDVLGMLTTYAPEGSNIGIRNTGLLLTGGLQVTGDDGIYINGYRYEMAEIEYVSSITQPYVDGDPYPNGTVCGVANDHPRYFHPGSYRTSKIKVLYQVPQAPPGT